MSLDREIGTFTPSQAREVWETTKLLRSSGLLRNLSKLTRPDDPGIHQVFVKSIEEEEEIPPFACMQITGTEDIGQLTYITVKRPTSTDGYYIFNHDNAIEPEGTGMGLPWGVVRMLASDVDPLKQYGPTVDSWEISLQDGGPFVVYGPDNTREGVVKGRITGGGAAAQVILFELINDEYGADAEVPEKCAERQPVTETTFRGEVIRVACGSSRPAFGEDYEGFVDLQDELGLLRDRDFREIDGKAGIAILMKPEGDYESCYWCIVYIDFHRKVQVITDLIFREDEIVIERKELSVWDDCELPEEIIEGTDCDEVDDYYEGGGI